MSRVLVNSLNVRTGPSTNTQKVAHYDAGQTIASGNLIIQNEGRYWLRYTGGSGNQRFVCMWENGQYFVDVPRGVPGPRPDDDDHKHDDDRYEVLPYLWVRHTFKQQHKRHGGLPDLCNAAHTAHSTDKC